MLDPFLFSYREVEGSLLPRYAAWLEEAGELARADWLRLLSRE